MSSTINQPNVKASFSLTETEPAAVPNGKPTLLETMQKNRSAWFFMVIFSPCLLSVSFFVKVCWILSKLTSYCTFLSHILIDDKQLQQHQYNHKTKPLLTVTNKVNIFIPGMQTFCEASPFSALGRIVCDLLLIYPIYQMIQYGRIQRAHLHVDLSVLEATTFASLFEFLGSNLAFCFKLPIWVGISCNIESILKQF